MLLVEGGEGIGIAALYQQRQVLVVEERVTSSVVFSPCGSRVLFWRVETPRFLF